MKRKIFSVFFALVLVLSFSLVTAVPVAADGEPATLNVEARTPPEITIDGTFDSGEWDDFFWFTDDSAGPGTGYDDDPLPIFTGYLAFDADNLYLAFDVEDNTPDTNRDFLYVTIDTPPAGDFNDPVDALYWGSTPDNASFFGEAYLTDGEFPWDRSQRGSTWGTDGGVVTARTITDTNRYYELEIPLAAIGATCGDTIGLKIQARGGQYTSETDPQVVNCYPDMPDGITPIRSDTRVEVEGNFAIHELLPYPTIQSAIDAANTGDTISVAAGTYYETIDVTTDDLTIQSVSDDPSDTIIDCDGVVNVVKITGCSGVTLSGFTIKGTNLGASGDGLYMLDVSGCSISDVVVTDIVGEITDSTWAGIKLENSADNIFDSVTVSDIEAFESYGIRVVDWAQTDRSYGNEFSSTTISGITGGKTAVGIQIMRSSSNSFDSTEITNLDVQEYSYGGGYSRGIEMVIAEQNTFTSTEISDITSTSIGIPTPLSFDSSGICLRLSGTMENTFSDFAISGLTTAGDTHGIYIFKAASNNAFSEGSITGADYGVQADSDAGSGNSIHYTNIVGNTEYGAYSDTVTLDATNNWWGHSSGPGDAISANVDAQPWLLEEDGDTYDKTLALNSDWSIVSPDSELASYVIVDSVDLILTYDKGGWTEIFELDPITPVFIKTADGGGVGLNYDGDSMGLFTTNLEAGWNLIGIPETGAGTGAILSPLRYGENDETALATLASQGQYNLSGKNFYKSAFDWTNNITVLTLDPFDGYWAYMNVAKEFGVVVVE